MELSTGSDLQGPFFLRVKRTQVGWVGRVGMGYYADRRV
jgi:hypothetical protein